MMIDKKLILKILETEFSENDNFRKKFAFLKEHEEINILCLEEPFGSIIIKMSTDQLVKLVKILTLAEKYFEWSGGSVATVIWIFRLIRSRDLKLSYYVADWILSHTNNVYLPFGTFNYSSKSLYEYYYREEQASIRKSEDIKREEEKQQFYKKLKQQKKIVQENKQRENAKKNEQRRLFVVEFMKKDPIERLKLISRDYAHPFEYYPTECTEVSLESIRSMDKELREALMKRIEGKKKGKWAELFKILKSI